MTVSGEKYVSNFSDILSCFNLISHHAYRVSVLQFIGVKIKVEIDNNVRSLLRKLVDLLSKKNLKTKGFCLYESVLAG